VSEAAASPRVVIRAERETDLPMIRHVNETAFGAPDEARLVDTLRTDGLVLLSAVADLDGLVVGHLLMVRMWIDTRDGTTDAVALAPMAVLPGHQCQGIGGRLIAFGLDAMRARGETIVIVVGHPGYYPRFGFTSAAARSLASPFPGDAFMALELAPGALDAAPGRVRYPAAFGL